MLGLVLFLALYNEAFPDATIDLTLSRDQIAQRANDYLKSQGYDVSDYESVVDFNQNWWASIYLQRTLGVAETNRLVKAERLPIWTWNARWFKPQQQEEFSLELMPDGEVIGFSHTISETAPGAALDQDCGARHCREISDGRSAVESERSRIDLGVVARAAGRARRSSL